MGGWERTPGGKRIWATRRCDRFVGGREFGDIAEGLVHDRRADLFGGFELPPVADEMRSAHFFFFRFGMRAKGSLLSSGSKPSRRHVFSICGGSGAVT